MSISDGPAERPSLRARLRRWLGIADQDEVIINLAQLVAGQRADFDELGRTLHVRDTERGIIDRQHRERAQRTEGLLETAVEQLNRTSQGFVDVNTRLRTYESNVPMIAKVKRAVDEDTMRKAARIKRQVELAVEANGGESQATFPHGPAPARECGTEGGAHTWQILGLYDKLDPPVPTLGCATCKWLWTRGWTQPEFDRWIRSVPEESRQRYAGLHFPAEPTYAHSASDGRSVQLPSNSPDFPSDGTDGPDPAPPPAPESAPAPTTEPAPDALEAPPMG